MTRPFLMGTHDAPQAGPSPLPAGAAQRASRSESAKKRATTSVFKPAQQCAPCTLSPSLPAATSLPMHLSGSDPITVTLKRACMRKGFAKMKNTAVCLSVQQPACFTVHIIASPLDFASAVIPAALYLCRSFSSADCGY